MQCKKYIIIYTIKSLLVAISLTALDCRRDLMRSYLSNRRKNADKATGAQLLLTKTPAAEKYGPVARTFPILIRHSRPAISRKKKATTFVL